jgi:hypothetical protein
MAEPEWEYYWIGSTGPFRYDPAARVNDRGLLFDEGTAPFQAPIVTTGQLTVKTAPSVANDVMRYGDLDVDDFVEGPTPATSINGGIAGWVGTSGREIGVSQATVSVAGTINAPAGQDITINGVSVAGGGDVSGPPSAVNNAVARWHSTGGDEIQSSTFIVDDDDYISSFGGRIVFPATMDASSYEHTLDYYAEGTWTPTIKFGGSSTSITYNSSQTHGFFTRIGQLVHVTCRCTLTNKGSSTGAATLAGLPYTLNSSEGRQAPCAVIYANAITFANTPAAYAGAGGTAVYLQEVTEGGTRTDLTDANFANDSDISISVTYMASPT